MLTQKTKQRSKQPLPNSVKEKLCLKSRIVSQQLRKLTRFSSLEMDVLQNRAPMRSLSRTVVPTMTLLKLARVLKAGRFLSNSEIYAKYWDTVHSRAYPQVM